MADMKVRDFAKSRGFTDDEITYNNGNVMLKGKQFISANPQADNYTYGDPNKLNQAFNNYNMNDALDTFKTNLSKPRQQFSYDANSDPLYQNALGAAQRSAQTAGNNASVRLGARGIGNSQQALTTENQIQQRAVADVNSNILPQLMNQAYSRYNDEQTRDDARNRDILGLAGTYNDLGQQGFNNDRLTAADASQKQQLHIDRANELRDKYGVFVKPTEEYSESLAQVEGLKPLNMRAYEDSRADTAFNQNIDTQQLNNSTRQTNASINNMNADNVRQAAATAKANGDDQMALRFKIWENTGLAPEGIPGVPKDTKLAGKSSSGKQTTYKDLPQFAESKTNIYKDPEATLAEMLKNKDDIIDFYGADGYGELVSLARKLIDDAKND